jgi:signal transduction histidine kinase
VCIRRLDDLPVEAEAERQSGLQVGIKSNLLIPLMVREAPVCAIGFGAFRREIDWPNAWIPRLRLVGALFANALVRKQAEEATQRLRHELAHAARIAMLGELTASMAHELNQPLAAILSNAQAVQRFLRSAVPNLAEVQEALADIIADDRRAGQIIRQLRSLGKKEALHRRLLDVNVLARQVIHLVRSEALEYQVTLTPELALDLPLVYGNRIQVQQVLLNLLLNAFEAMRQTHDRPRLAVLRTTCQDTSVLVTLQDTGVGVEANTLPHMFSAFYTTKAEGMGLGLAISRSIIEAHGGRIGAYPNPDHGTTVFFTLPLSSAR